MLRRRVNRYVDRVVSYLPLLERRRARSVITSAIYARLDDITGNMKPTPHDLRMVLREMGHPKHLAEAYYCDFHVSVWDKLDIWKCIHRLVLVLTVVALVLVVFGVLELVMGVGNMGGFMLGLSLGVVVVFYQMVIQPRIPTKEKSNHHYAI